MADPAKAAKTTYAERRRRGRRTCQEEGCPAVRSFLSGKYIKDPKCVTCIHEAKLLLKAEELGL